MNKVTLRGSAAQVKYGYLPAAELGAWTLDGPLLSARLLSHDAFRLSQTPLTFVVKRAKGFPWTWAIETYTIAHDGQLTAVVRTQE